MGPPSAHNMAHNILHAALFVGGGGGAADSGMATTAGRIPLGELADYLQVHKSISVDDLVGELLSRGWASYAPALVKQQGWQVGLLTPDDVHYLERMQQVLPEWALCEDDVTWDVLGRCHLKDRRSWPGARTITSVAALCALLRSIEPSHQTKAILLSDTANGASAATSGLFECDLASAALLSSGQWANGATLFAQNAGSQQQQQQHQLQQQLQAMQQLAGQQQQQPRQMTAAAAAQMAAQQQHLAQRAGNNGRGGGRGSWGAQRQSSITSASAGGNQQQSAKHALAAGGFPVGGGGGGRGAPPAAALPVAGGRVTGPVLTPKPQVREKDRLHRVLRLGWRPLVDVVCNSLAGRFLGGHDKDLYIQCTSPGYEGLPLIDVKEGGCIMTCAQFEKRAGRELSKKWKESIHVVGDSEGSRATLITWLRRQAAKKFGDRVVGKSCWIRWCSDGEFYQATFLSYNMDTGKHKVRYSESLYVEELHLPVELVYFTEAKPSMPDLTASQVMASLSTYHEYCSLEELTAMQQLQQGGGGAAAAAVLAGNNAHQDEAMSDAVARSPGKRARAISTDGETGRSDSDGIAAATLQTLLGRRRGAQAAELDVGGGNAKMMRLCELVAAAGGAQLDATASGEGSAGGKSDLAQVVSLRNGTTGIALTARDLLALVEQQGGPLSSTLTSQLAAAVAAAGSGDALQVELPSADALLLLAQLGAAQNSGTRGGSRNSGSRQQSPRQGDRADGNGHLLSLLLEQLRQQQPSSPQRTAQRSASPKPGGGASPNSRRDSLGGAGGDSVDGGTASRRTSSGEKRGGAAPSPRKSSPPGTRTTSVTPAPTPLVIPEDLTLPGPPDAGLAEENAGAMFRWMMALCVELEGLLAQHQRNLNSPALPMSLDLATRFQTMLVFARSQDHQLEGFYAMLVARWQKAGGATNPTEARARSLVEAITSMVYQSSFLKPSEGAGAAPDN